MNTYGALFTLLVCLLQLALPRRWAILPLLLTFALMTRGQVLDVFGANFTVLRIVVGIGFLRVLLRNERPARSMNAIDAWMFVWAFWLLVTAAFHVDGAFVLRAGLVWDYLGLYFLSRTFMTDTEDVLRAFRMLCFLLIPAAISMVIEKVSGHNAFAVLGGVPEFAAVRAGGQIRASGPYAHAILAGTVGATLLTLAWCVRKTSRVAAVSGAAAGLAMVFAASSSGPLLMAAFTLLGAVLWKFRRHLSAIRWLALAGIAGLAFVMQDPVYFLMAKVDITGGSTGWYRAQLIRSSIEHIDEWWLVGTDYTRHWMYTGNPANPESSDITNQYLENGVMGGLPLMAIFIMVFLSAFRRVGQAVNTPSALSESDRYLVWMIGACLFGHSMNFLAVTFWDHSIGSFLFLLAAISAIQPEPAAESNLLPQSPPALLQSLAGSAVRSSYLRR
jgi:hypothetical protein